MKEIFSLLFISITSLVFCQGRDYSELTKDTKNGNWYFSFEKKTNDGFYSWLKLEEPNEENPNVKSKEYFIEFKCSSKNMSDEVVIINWKNKKVPEIHREKFPFKEIPHQHIAMKLIDKFCN